MPHLKLEPKFTMATLILLARLTDTSVIDDQIMRLFLFGAICDKFNDVQVSDPSYSYDSDK
jgi:hypothetical protein